MKCFISYRRANADTINGEALIVSQRYSTFDKAEMDRLEDYLKSSMGCGVSVEYDIDKCIKNEKKANDVVLQQIKDEIEQIADEEQKHDEKWATGLRYAVKIINKYEEKE